MISPPPVQQVLGLGTQSSGVIQQFNSIPNGNVQQGNINQQVLLRRFIILILRQIILVVIKSKKRLIQFCKAGRTNPAGENIKF